MTVVWPDDAVSAHQDGSGVTREGPVPVTETLLLYLGEGLSGPLDATCLQ